MNKTMPRYTIDVGEKFDEILTKLARSNETTKSEIIRRAVASYSLLTEQTTDGRKVSITDGQDRVLKDILLP